MQSYEASIAIEFTFVDVLSSIPEKGYEQEVNIRDAKVVAELR